MFTVIAIVIVAIATVIGVSSYYIDGPQNKVEQICEEIIEVETGHTVNLDPVAENQPAVGATAASTQPAAPTTSPLPPQT